MNMKNAVVLVVMLTLGFVGLFAQETVYTSEGAYMAGIVSDGKNRGQQSYDEGVRNQRTWGETVTTGITLTKGQWECVNEMLGKYSTSRGDTFTIEMFSIEGSPRLVFIIFVICEFTSATQYNYWTFQIMKRL